MREHLTGMKRVVEFRAAFGTGAVLTNALVLDRMHRYQSRPEPWHANTIVGLSATAAQTFTYNPESREMKPVGFTFSFIVENKSGRDYKVPQDVKLLKRDKKSQALVELRANSTTHMLFWRRSARSSLLASNIAVRRSDLDTNREKVRDVRTCFDDALADVGGFVALDYSSKIRIELPKPVLAPVSPQRAPQRLLTTFPLKIPYAISLFSWGRCVASC
jgi:hypothetical protein